MSQRQSGGSTFDKMMKGKRPGDDVTRVIKAARGPDRVPLSGHTVGRWVKAGLIEKRDDGRIILKTTTKDDASEA